MFIISSFVVIVLVGIGLVIPTRFSKRSEKIFGQLQFQRIISSGKSYLAAISPDGKYIVHVRDEAGKQSLWVRQIEETHDVEIVAPAEVEYMGVTISPDNHRIYYNSWQPNVTDYTLFQVPILGGMPKKLLAEMEGAVCFSPDGGKIAFTRSAPSQGFSHLVVANSDGTGESVLATRRSPDTFESEFGSPAWSPDGKSIAVAHASNSFGVKTKIVLFNVADGTETVLTESIWDSTGQIVWLGDGSGLLMIGRQTSSKPYQIWYLSYPGGEIRQITNDLNSYRGISLSSDLSTILSLQTEQTLNFWVSKDASIEKAELSFTQSGFEDAGFTWTPDNKIILFLNESGRNEILEMDPDTRQKKLLVSNENSNIMPTVSPDGKTIVYASNQSGDYRLWRTDRDGSNPQPLTKKNDDTELYPHFSPDGRWIVYQKGWRGSKIWKVAPDGSEETALTGKGLAMRPRVSPDGRFVALNYLEGEVWSLMIVSIDDGKLIQKFPLPPSVSSRSSRWTPDGKAVTYIDTREGVSNIWVQSLDKRSPSRLTNFDTERIFFFDWSADSKNFAFGRGTINNNVIAIKIDD